jgi:hypothetical protein
MLDTKALAEVTATIIREHVAAATAPLIERIAALEAREIPEAIKGDPGDPGASVDMAAVQKQIADLVAAGIADLPPPQRGEKGDSVELSAVQEMVRGEVDRVVAGLPPAEKGDPGEKGDKGDDGAGIADLLIDRDHDMIATFTDGRMKNLGRVVGKDGDPGKPGDKGRDGPGPEDFSMQLLEDGRTLRISICRADDETEYAWQIGFAVPLDRGDFEVGRSYEEADIVSHGGALWMAQRDTSAAPGESADWRLAVARGADGVVPYAGAAKGLYDPSAVYRAMDVVSHNGSEWRAKRDDPGDLPGDGWMLSAGKGKRGDKGDPGRAGKTAPSIAATYVDAAEMTHVITLDDGTEIKADLEPIVSAIGQLIEGGRFG